MLAPSRILGRRNNNSRRLALAALDWTRAKDPPMSLGQASIVAELQQQQIDVRHRCWAVNRDTFDPREVVSWAMAHDDGITDFGVGAFVWNEKAVQYILGSLKEKSFQGRLILGGPQVSYVTQGLEEYYIDADIFIRGYAEQALARLLKDDCSGSFIPGVHLRRQPDLGTSARTRLEELPSPFLSGIIRPQRFLRWETQRGCPFRCAFCQHREATDNEALTRRQLSRDRILEEIRWICEHEVISDVAVLDPTFNAGPDYLMVLDELSKHGFRGKLSLQCRAEMVRDEFLGAVKHLNDVGARVVLEFGLQTIHKAEQRIIQRPNNLAKVDSVLEACRSMSIEFELSLIYGLPEQTLASFRESVEWCLERAPRPDAVSAFPLMLLRGTPLYDRKEELGLVESESDVVLGDSSAKTHRILEGIPHVVSSPSFSKSDWIAMAKLAKELTKPVPDDTVSL